MAGVTTDVGLKRKHSDPAAGMSEYNPQTSTGGPDNPTPLLGDAEHQFKSTGQLGVRVYLEAGAPRGIVKDIAVNNRSLRANDQFGLGSPACRPNASKPPRIHYQSLSLSMVRNPSGSLSDYPENSVSFSCLSRRIDAIVMQSANRPRHPRSQVRHERL
jgi:hypothetical protein